MKGQGLLGMRVRLAPDVSYDAATGVLWTPRRNPVERLIARLVRPRAKDLRVRVALDTEGRRVLGAIAGGPARGVPVADLVAVPDATGPAGREEAAAPGRAALLLYLDALVAARCLVAEPI